ISFSSNNSILVVYHTTEDLFYELLEYKNSPEYFSEAGNIFYSFHDDKIVIRQICLDEKILISFFGNSTSKKFIDLLKDYDCGKGRNVSVFTLKLPSYVALTNEFLNKFIIHFKNNFKIKVILII
ncbi:MAG: hypothetical protein QXV60_03315, partial [Nitrososphaerota archaeon]